MNEVTDITYDNPFGLKTELFETERYNHLTCPNCGHHTVIKVFESNDKFDSKKILVYGDDKFKKF